MAKGFYAGKNVLVTGVMGLIGSWLAARLIKEGANVVGIVRDDKPSSNFYQSGLDKKVVIIHGDITDINLVERVVVEYNCEFVFHIASQTPPHSSQRSPLSTFEVNIRGTWNLLEVVRRVLSVEGFVLVSSAEVYDGKFEPPYTEDSVLGGRHPLVVTKIAADMFTTSYHHVYQLPLVIARCSEVYGGGDLNFQKLIPSTIRAILLGENPLLRSDGASVREYIYVEDLVEGLIRLGIQLRSQQLEGEAFNITSGEAMTDLAVVESILSKMNRPDLRPIILSQAHEEAPKITLNSEKASNLLGFTPHYEFDESIAKVIPWYDNYLRRYTFLL